MGLLDRVILTACHDISGIIAVHNKQYYFARWKVLLVGVLAWAIQPGLAATMAQPSKPDPLLDGGPTPPCAAGSDYAAGTDATGRPVVPADVAAGRVPLPDAVAIPLGNNRGVDGAHRRRPANSQSLGGDSTYVTLDGRKLEPLLNPAPCLDPAR